MWKGTGNEKRMGICTVSDSGVKGSKLMKFRASRVSSSRFKVYALAPKP